MNLHVKKHMRRYSSASSARLQDSAPCISFHTDASGLVKTHQLPVGEARAPHFARRLVASSGSSLAAWYCTIQRLLAEHQTQRSAKNKTSNTNTFTYPDTQSYVCGATSSRCSEACLVHAFSPHTSLLPVYTSALKQLTAICNQTQDPCCAVLRTCHAVEALARQTP
jgi:hypothetical protein